MLKITEIILGNKKPPYLLADDKMLCFRWTCDTDNCDAEQKTYRLIIRDTKSLLYDSDYIFSSDMKAEVYFPNFPSGDVLSAELEVEDREGNRAKRKEFFKTAYFGKWQGEWIKSSGEISGAVAFLKKINIEKEVSRAAVFYCALGVGKAYINGEKLSENRLVTPFTNYNKECMYETDIIPKECLKQGENIIKIIAAPGWRKNYGPFLENLSEDRKITFMGEICLSAQLFIEYTDRTSEIIPTDTSWKASACEYERAHLFDGETYNFRLVKDEESLYKDAEGVQISDFKTEFLHSTTIEPIVVKNTVEPINSYLKNGKTIYDFKYNMAGVLKISLNGEATEGTRIIINHAELLDENGELYTLPLRSASQRDEIVLKKGTINEAYTPEFVYHGFRYASIEVQGEFIGRIEPEFLVFYTDIDTESYFKCSNQLVNEIYEAAVRTERSNLHSIATDCPQRDERMGWLNDATVRFPAMIYNFNILSLFDKIVRDIKNEQDNLGRITCTAPFVYGERPADPVCSSFIIAGMLLCRMGDKDAINRHFDAFCAWNNYLKSRYKDGCIDYSYYGDWAGPEDSCYVVSTIGNSDTEKTEEYDTGAANSKYAPGTMVSALFYYLNLTILGEMARIKGDSKESFYDEAKIVQQDFLKKWVDTSTGRVYNGSQACQALALGVGIIPEYLEKKAAEICADAVISAGVRFETGNLATPILLDVLTKYGYNELAWKLFTKPDYPSLGYMLRNGATTIWERFELKKEFGMNSHNHPMYASVSAWLFRSMAGIDAKDIIKIRPQIPEELLFFELSCPTLKGMTYMKYEYKYGEEIFFIKLPMGLTGEFEYKNTKASLHQGFNVIKIVK